MAGKARKPRQLRLFSRRQMRLAGVRTPAQLAGFGQRALALAEYAREEAAKIAPEAGGLTRPQISWNEGNFKRHVSAIRRLLESPITLRNVERKEREISQRISTIEQRMQRIGIKKPA